MSFVKYLDSKMRNMESNKKGTSSSKTPNNTNERSERERARDAKKKNGSEMLFCCRYCRLPVAFHSFTISGSCCMSIDKLHIHWIKSECVTSVCGQYLCAHVCVRVWMCVCVIFVEANGQLSELANGREKRALLNWPGFSSCRILVLSLFLCWL